MKTENSLPLRPDMALAYAEDRKWVTRRKITRLKGIGKITEFGHNDEVSHEWVCRDKRMLWNDLTTNQLLNRCPYGRPGERIRLLTTWAVHRCWDDSPPLEMPHGLNSSTDGCFGFWSYFESVPKPDKFGRLRPGRFLPMRMRHLMPYPKILSIGAERVQDISSRDAITEGIDPREVAAREWVNARVGFRALWDAIHGPGAWERNEYVWPIELQKYSEVSDANK